ncbi:unnamed protein product [Choristocarpus tenellus]
MNANSQEVGSKPQRCCQLCLSHLVKIGATFLFKIVCILACLRGNEASSNQRKYDGSTIIYDPKGRMYQVEYAQEATLRGCTVVGVCDGDCVVLAAWTPSPSTIRALPAKAIWTVDSHVGLAASGLRSDVQYLTDNAFKWCSEHHYVFSSSIPCHVLTRRIADVIHSCTVRGGKRPLAVDMLVAGFDEHMGASLHQVQTTGAVQRYKAVAIGANAAAAKSDLVRSGLESEGPTSSLETKVKKSADEEAGCGLDRDGKIDSTLLTEHAKDCSDDANGNLGGKGLGQTLTPGYRAVLKRAISALCKAGCPDGEGEGRLINASELSAVVYRQVVVGRELTGGGEAEGYWSRWRKSDGIGGGLCAEGIVCSAEDLEDILDELVTESEGKKDGDCSDETPSL